MGLLFAFMVMALCATPSALSLRGSAGNEGVSFFVELWLLIHVTDSSRRLKDVRRIFFFFFVINL